MVLAVCFGCGCISERGRNEQLGLGAQLVLLLMEQSSGRLLGFINHI